MGNGADVFERKPLSREQLRSLGWTTKRWRSFGGQPFTASGVARVLGNVIYTGRIRHKGEIYPGEHPRVPRSKLGPNLGAAPVADGEASVHNATRPAFSRVLTGLAAENGFVHSAPREFLLC
jgi:hypothetical protein